MGKLGELWRRLLFFRRRAQSEEELHEEMLFHLEMKIQDNIDAGMSPEQARRAAHLKFGNGTLAREDSRAVWSFGWLETLWQDICYGIRTLSQSPGFTAIVLVSLALGIGANTAIFSVVNAALLRQSPFVEPERLVVLQLRDLKSERVSNPPFSHSYAWRQDDTIFESLALFTYGGTETRWVEGKGEHVGTQLVSPEIFETLGISPLLGRGFSREDLLGPNVISSISKSSTVVISYGFWQSRFGGRKDIIGQTLDMGGTGLTIVGVMPPGFYIVPWANDVDIWRAWESRRGRGSWATTIARLHRGGSVEQAEERCQAILLALDPSTTESPRSVHAESFQEYKSADYSENLYFLQAAVGLILLIACFNVAGLLLERGVGRRREIATRKALGAGPIRVCRQLLTESLLLAVGGGALGILLALGGIRLFVAIAGDFYPVTEEFRIDTVVLTVTMGVALATGIVFGLFPVWQGAGVDANAALKDGMRTTGGPLGRRLRGILVAAQVALSVVLLMGSGLMINSLARMLNEDLGFDPDQLLTMQVQLDGPKYVEEGPPTLLKPGTEQFWSQALAQVGGLPRVQSVGMASALPPSSGRRAGISIPGRPPADPSEQPFTMFQEVDAGYFSTMRIPLLRGSPLSGREGALSTAVAVVDDVFVKTFFPGEDAVGKHVTLRIGPGYTGIINDRPREIIGVVQSVKSNFRRPARPMLYMPYQQHFREFPWRSFTNVHLEKGFVIRTSADPEDLAAAARQAVSRVDPGAVVSDIRTMRSRVGGSRQIVPVRFFMRLLSVFSVLAVFLAVIGLYGVVSYSVTRRTHEFGIRMALGAGYRDVVKLAGKEALVIVAAGAIAGLAAAIGLVRFIEHQLYGLTATDPLTVALVLALLLAAAAVASYVPARRAAKVDPMVALRHE